MTKQLNAQADVVVERLRELRKQSEKINSSELDWLWGQLPTVRVEDILDRWKGAALDTGHRVVGQLAAIKWFGKDFLSFFDIKPILCHNDSEPFSSGGDLVVL